MMGEAELQLHGADLTKQAASYKQKQSGNSFGKGATSTRGNF